MKTILMKGRPGVAVPHHDPTHGFRANPTALRQPRRDRLIHEHIHDPYKARMKLPEPTVCPRCGATYHQGRWHWAGAYPEKAHREVCQACHRIEDHYPAGEIILQGAFVGRHRQEILRLARHQEAREKQEHPLHRIMRVQDHPGALVIQTTDLHLPRRIGEALRGAFKGRLRQEYEQEACFIRVRWQHEE